MRYQTGLYINLGYLGENVEQLRKGCKNNEFIFMVKAEAYGHGMVQIVKYANSELKIKEFGVASLGEALKLRKELPDLKFEIYVFSDIQLELHPCSDLYLNHRIIPVISNFSDLDFLLNNSNFLNFPICLKFNTGMNRLGLDCGLSEVDKVISKLKNRGRKSIYHLCSHFSSASESMVENDKSRRQYEKFKKIKKQFADEKIEVERSSISNSGAIEQKFGLEESHIRPGLILYGPSALNKACRHLSWFKGKNISKLLTYIIDVFPVKRGMLIGYGETVVPDDGVIALIALGYGDGFSARLTGPSLKFEDEVGEVLGKVNMDITQVFFRNIKIKNLKAGNLFTVWGHNPQDILDLADQTDTICYEHLCQLTARIPRYYCD